MNTSPVGFFGSGINSVDASSKLPFFPSDFIGRVRVHACKGITTRDGRRAYIAELDVLSSNTDKVQVGARYSWYQDLTETGTAWPACIAFLYACLGLDPSRDKAKIEAEVKPKQDQWLNLSVNEDPRVGKTNVLAGAELMLQTTTKITKKKGTPFTLHSFSALPPAAQ